MLKNNTLRIFCHTLFKKKIYKIWVNCKQQNPYLHLALLLQIKAWGLNPYIFSINPDAQ